MTQSIINQLQTDTEFLHLISVTLHDNVETLRNNLLEFNNVHRHLIDIQNQRRLHINCDISHILRRKL